MCRLWVIDFIIPRYIYFRYMHKIVKYFNIISVFLIDKNEMNMYVFSNGKAGPQDIFYNSFKISIFK